MLIPPLLLTLLTTARTIFFNHAGASPSPDSVIDTVIEHLKLEQQVGGYTAAKMVDTRAVYEKAAQLIHAQPSEIALVESATVASTRLFYSFVEAQTTRNIILVSQIEYAATVVAAVRYAQTHSGWEVRMIPSVEGTGKVDVEKLSLILEGKDPSIDPDSIALVCITHIPTNSGVVNPVEQVGELIRDYNRGREDRIYYLCDACQSMGQVPLDVRRIHCDGLIGTGRKYLRGPRGTGILYISSSCNIWPFQVDHNSVPVKSIPSKDVVSDNIADLLEIQPKPDAMRFEFWESNTSGRLGLGKALEIAIESENEGKASNIRSLAEMLYENLREIAQVETYYPPECGIVTFIVKDVEALDVQARMWERDDCRFELSVVPATSTPLDSAVTETPALVRASLMYTNTKEEIDLFTKVLRSVL